MTINKKGYQKIVQVTIIITRSIEQSIENLLYQISFKTSYFIKFLLFIKTKPNQKLSFRRFSFHKYYLNRNVIILTRTCAIETYEFFFVTKIKFTYFEWFYSTHMLHRVVKIALLLQRSFAAKNSAVSSQSSIFHVTRVLQRIFVEFPSGFD